MASFIGITFWMVLLVTVWVRMWRENARDKFHDLWRDGLCPECEYELNELWTSGCPECGWGRLHEPDARARGERAESRGV